MNGLQKRFVWETIHHLPRDLFEWHHFFLYWEQTKYIVLMAPVYFYIEHRFPRRTFNTLIKLIMITVYPLSRSPYISLLDCLHPIHC